MKFWIISNADRKGIKIEAIGGHDNHVHCLIRMPTTISISKVAQLLKGESAFWINTNLQLPFYFNWEEGYHVNAVSKYDIEKVKRYILNQEKHHENKK